jgi:hypothetical protein
MSTDKQSVYIIADKNKEKHKARNNNKHIFFAKNIGKHSGWQLTTFIIYMRHFCLPHVSAENGASPINPIFDRNMW